MFNKIKSPETLFNSTEELLDVMMDKLIIIQTEMRAQRQDLSTIKRQLHTLINTANSQKQVDEYFEDSKQREEVVENNGIESNN